jgi:hypothetical protein
MSKPTKDLRIAIAARGLAGKEVAKRAKIHPSRLSRPLHEHEQLTPSTGRRIVQAIYPELFEEVSDDLPAA